MKCTQVLTLCGDMTFALKHRGRNSPPLLCLLYVLLDTLLRLYDLFLLIFSFGVDIIQTHAHCCYLHLV